MSTHCKSAQLGSLDIYLVASLAAVILNTLPWLSLSQPGSLTSAQSLKHLIASLAAVIFIILHQRQNTHKVCDRTESLRIVPSSISIINIAIPPGVPLGHPGFPPRYSHHWKTLPRSSSSRLWPPRHIGCKVGFYIAMVIMFGWTRRLRL